MSKVSAARWQQQAPGSAEQASGSSSLSSAPRELLESATFCLDKLVPGEPPVAVNGLQPFKVVQGLGTHEERIVAEYLPGILTAADTNTELQVQMFLEGTPVARSSNTSNDFMVIAGNRVPAGGPGIFGKYVMNEAKQGEYESKAARYSKMSESSKTYIITQYGLSCFEPAGSGALQARTFNFYLFPQPHGTYNRRFLCDASSLAFLAQHGFDFNACISRGVPFMPIRTRDHQLVQVNRSSEPRTGDTVAATTDEDRAFVADLVALVTDWLAGKPLSSDSLRPMESAAAAGAVKDEAEPGSGPDEDVANTADLGDDELLLPRMNSFRRLLAYQELGKAQFGVEGHPGFWVKKCDDPRYLCLVRASPQRCQELESQAKAARLEAIRDAAGFAAVFDAMRRSGKPAVGHNCMFDVAYGLYSFADTYLPTSWRDYKKMVRAWHPGGMFDTKYLARQLPEVFGQDTSLSQVYRLLTQPDLEQTAAVQQLLAAASAAAGQPVELPAVSCAPGFDKYRHLAAGEAAHEAGYDAYMTGVVFARLLPLVQGKIAAEPSSELGRAYTQAREKAAQEAAAAAAVAAAAAPAAEAAAPGVPAVDTAQRDLKAKLESPEQQQHQQQQQQQDIAGVLDLLQFVRCVCGRLNLTFSDIAYAAVMEEQDPIPERPSIFHITGLSSTWRTGELWRTLQRAGLGQVRITVLDSSSCLVEFKPEYVDVVVQTIGEHDSSLEVIPWRDYAHRRYHRRLPEEEEEEEEGDKEEDGEGGAGKGSSSKRPRTEGAVIQETSSQQQKPVDMEVDDVTGQPSSHSRCSIM